MYTILPFQEETTCDSAILRQYFEIHGNLVVLVNLADLSLLFKIIEDVK